jgi:hypothetical protein
MTQFTAISAEKEELLAFKKGIEKKEKEAMIASFYMLSDEDKQDVVDHIDEYKLDEIEAKLSVICVRNKVNFNLEDDNDDQATIYNLHNGDLSNDDAMPAWVKAIEANKAKNR